MCKARREVVKADKTAQRTRRTVLAFEESGIKWVVAGDVFITHGLIPHTATPNHLHYARVITNPHVNLNRADGDYVRSSPQDCYHADGHRLRVSKCSSEPSEENLYQNTNPLDPVYPSTLEQRTTSERRSPRSSNVCSPKLEQKGSDQNRSTVST